MHRPLLWCILRFEWSSVINESMNSIVVHRYPALIIWTWVHFWLKKQPSSKVLASANLKLVEHEVHLPQRPVVACPCVRVHLGRRFTPVHLQPIWRYYGLVRIWPDVVLWRVSHRVIRVQE